MGRNLTRILECFWNDQQIIPRQQGYNGPAIKPSRGQIQGSIFLPMSFNILADKVIRYWLSLTVDDNGDATILGLGQTVANWLAVLFADDTLVASMNPHWLQQALDLLVQLFQ